MNEASALFFRLIQIGVQRRRDPFFQPSADEWVLLYEMASKHTLQGVCFEALQWLDSNQKPPKNILLRWYAVAEDIKKRNITIFKESVKAQSYFAEYGYLSCVLKGCGIANYYPIPQYRVCGDIDIWVDCERRQIISFIQSKVPLSKGLVVYHNISLPFSKPCPVEIHFTPSWMFSYFTNKRLQSFFKREKEHIFGHTIRRENTKELNVPTVAFNRVYILIHIYRHLFGEGVGLRQLMDYYYVLKQGFTEEERLDTVTILKKLKMEKFARGIMYVLQKVFAMESSFFILPPDRLHGEFLLSEVVQAGNFGHYDQRKQTNMNDSPGVLFFKRCRRNLRFFRYYPSETLWTPWFKIWHFCWRKYHGWI